MRITRVVNRPNPPTRLHNVATDCILVDGSSVIR
jgi:hypothetical protein